MTLPDDPARLLDVATQLLRAGRVAEAIAAHEQLLQWHPALPDSWYNLGFLYHRARRFEAALDAYAQALRHGVQGPEEVHLNRAVILADHLARSDEAEAELRTALALNPRFVPALVNLGNLHEQRGEREPARDACERVLALEPAHALALARLANLRRVASPADPLIARLKAALARPGIGPDEYADLAFGLGKALDDAGSYDEAFAAYAAANAASRAAAGPNAPRYDAAAHERRIDRLIAAFPRPASPGAASAADDGPQQLFICGMFRSGSTLVEQILAGHPAVTAGGEIDLLPALVREHVAPRLAAGQPLDDALLQQLRSRYRDGVAALHPGAALVTDKRPDNFLHIGLIKALFPSAKIVHTRRDPLDNGLAIYFLHLSHAMPHAQDLADIGHWYRQYRRLMAHWKALYGADIHDVDYDALVAEPRPAIEALLHHVGVPWHAGCLEFHRNRGIVQTPSAWQVREPLYTRSSGRWRNYARHLGPLREGLGADLLS